MLQAVCADAQPGVESFSLVRTPVAEPGAVGDPLHAVLALDVAARAAQGRVAQAIGTFPPAQRIKPSWALALVRLEQMRRGLTVGQFTALCDMGTNGSYAVQRLVELGLLARVDGGGDRRVRLVWLSGDGAAWLERLRAELGR